MTIRSITGKFPDDVIEGFCTECHRTITQTGCGPEIGHEHDCMWTMHDGAEQRTNAARNK